MKGGEHKRDIAPSFFIPHIIITYSLNHLDRVKKTLFGYALKGRTGKTGLIDELKGKILGRNCFRIPETQYNQAETFLQYWKVVFETEKAYYVDNQQNRKKIGENP